MPREIAERQDVIPALGTIFREHGFAGASLSEITQRTGLGKGSLYHFFPNGKKEMAEAVLLDVASWFEAHVFNPLRQSRDGASGIQEMFAAVDAYFHSGKRICLMGAFALDATRDQFDASVKEYFELWVRALAIALKRAGFAGREARGTAEDVVAAIQGALVLARSLDDPAVFSRILKRTRDRMAVDRHV